MGGGVAGEGGGTQDLARSVDAQAFATQSAEGAEVGDLVGDGVGGGAKR